MTEQALRECPFCGSKKTFARSLIGDVDFVAACSKCNGSIVKGTKDQAIAAWNTRAYDAELEELTMVKRKLEMLKASVEHIRNACVQFGLPNLAINFEELLK